MDCRIVADGILIENADPGRVIVGILRDRRSQVDAVLHAVRVQDRERELPLAGALAAAALGAGFASGVAWSAGRRRSGVWRAS